MKLVERSLCYFLTYIVMRGGVPRVGIYDSLILAPESTGFEILPRAVILSRARALSRVHVIAATAAVM